MPWSPQTESSARPAHDPFHVDPAAREKADAARRTWSAGEKAYDELARRETAAQPSLAMYTTGGGAAIEARRRQRRLA